MEEVTKELRALWPGIELPDQKVAVCRLNVLFTDLKSTNKYARVEC